jgi:hypothetical protein
MRNEVVWGIFLEGGILNISIDRKKAIMLMAFHTLKLEKKWKKSKRK